MDSKTRSLVKVKFDRIRSRCENKRHDKFRYYGGRGIQCLLSLDDLCEIWERDNASLMIKPTIDRIDNDGHYEVSNCRFIEMTENRLRGNGKRGMMTAEKVLDIRRRYTGKRGELKMFAGEVNRAICTISDIVFRRTWKHI